MHDSMAGELWNLTAPVDGLPSGRYWGRVMCGMAVLVCLLDQPECCDGLPHIAGELWNQTLTDYAGLLWMVSY
jgi:hypothetical protein